MFYLFDKFYYPYEKNLQIGVNLHEIKYEQQKYKHCTLKSQKIRKIKIRQTFFPLNRESDNYLIEEY